MHRLARDNLSNANVCLSVRRTAHIRPSRVASVLRPRQPGNKPMPYLYSAIVCGFAALTFIVLAIRSHNNDRRDYRTRRNYNLARAERVYSGAGYRSGNNTR